MAKEKKQNLLEAWQPLADPAKLTPNPKGDGFIVTIPMPSFEADEDKANQFIEEVNEALKHKISTTPGLDLKANFALRDLQTARFTRAVAQFAAFAGARKCLSLLKACGLRVHEDISPELERFGKEYDQWVEKTANLSFFAKLLGRGPAKPTPFVPPLKAKLDLREGGEKPPEEEGKPARPRKKKRREREGE
ncbi:MAG: hypothetical protein JO112_12230 [Planctomycetes bacterium]|nr:hypothetical protein [Planctomycetota bacterium]